MVEALGHVCFYFLVSHLPFAYNWQTRLLDSELVITRFPSGTCGTSNMRIPRNFTNFPDVCMLFSVCVGWDRAVHLNIVLSLILLILLEELTNQKRGICKHYICTLYDLGSHSLMMLEI